MFLILSQKIKTESEYKDVPFEIYHFPSRYRNQIKTGDIFIYYQGDRRHRKNRYYFGCGVIGEVTPAEEGHYNAQLIETHKFDKVVPIYEADNKFYESIDYSSVRKKPVPAWQNSIRKISASAFTTILSAAGINKEQIQKWTDAQTTNVQSEDLSILYPLFESLNEQQVELLLEEPQEYEIEKMLANLDPSGSMTTRQAIQKVRNVSTKTIEELKNLYNHTCQICGANHQQLYGVNVTEAHHIDYFSKTQNHHYSNIIILCPTHHRLVHAGNALLDRKRKVFRYENGYEESLKLNKHL